MKLTKQQFINRVLPNLPEDFDVDFITYFKRNFIDFNKSDFVHIIPGLYHSDYIFNLLSPLSANGKGLELFIEDNAYYFEIIKED